MYRSQSDYYLVLFSIIRWGRTTDELPHQFPDVIQDAAVPGVQIHYCKERLLNPGSVSQICIYALGKLEQQGISKIQLLYTHVKYSDISLETFLRLI